MTAELELNVPAKITVQDDDGFTIALRIYRFDGTFVDKGQAELFDTPEMKDMISKAENHFK